MAPMLYGGHSPQFKKLQSRVLFSHWLLGSFQEVGHKASVFTPITVSVEVWPDFMVTVASQSPLSHFTLYLEGFLRLGAELS